ncbi:type VI secretion system Vgr family protein [Entomohabitans teleogrylli]|uniref:type VI secretion system Vgr family protein n=1 Tax=Entomohabitans teleogrylli TaxID=1384589 RepID=UPI00073D410B|nr:type VI secretion system tip protein TssI/VgrG [Entomohabitans teleogrylli]
MDRVIVAHTPLDLDTLLFKSLTGNETLSGLFEFHIELLSTRNDINLRELLGKPLTVELRPQPHIARYLNGYITRMTLAGREINSERYYLYRACVRPGLWYLTQNRDFRIWQEKSVPDIIASVLAGYQIKFENRLISKYREWGYCVQYQESDFDFISRLMEHEGIYYYFHHEMGSHTLILADSPDSHEPLAGYETIPWKTAESGNHQNTESIHDWSVSDAITPAMYSLDDYDFRKPRAHLLETRHNPLSCAADKAEIFDWPGRFTDREHSQFYVQVRQQEFESQHETMQGEASALGLAPGHSFLLTRAPRIADCREYLTVSASYQFYEGHYASGDSNRAEQRTRFSVIPRDVQWRPGRQTPWPKTHGPQTAEVVGPPGNPIWTDKYGRVKLKFRWDRHSSDSDASSCWVRVSSSWAGWKYGGVQIPRVGEEVVVDFINGDPDRPLVTGRVYNENNMPPWDLPNDATRMGFMSRSTNGSQDNASYLFFEDSPGQESFDMHAEKQMNISVEGDKNVSIDGTRTTVIGGEQHDTVYGDASFHFKGSREVTVDGLEKNTFNSRQEVEITDGRQFTITSGGDEVNITDDISRTFNGNITEETIGDIVQTVTGNTAQHNDGDITRTIVGHIEETITGDVINNTTGDVTLAITGDVTEDITGNKTEEIVGELTESVTGSWTQDATGNISISSDSAITIKSDVAIMMEAPNLTNQSKSNSFTFRPLSNTFTYIESFSYNTLGMSVTPFSLGITGFKISNNPVEFHFDNGVKIKVAGVQWDNLAMGIHAAALWAFL